MGLLLSSLMVLFSSLAFADYPIIPDEQITPGDVCSRSDRHFDGYRYSEKIPYCHRKVSRELKSDIYKSYNIPQGCRHRYTIDHFYPLSMGGNNNRKNLWPEHLLVKALREHLEQDVFEDLRDGDITQKEALGIIHHEKMNPPIEEIESYIELYGKGACDKAAVLELKNILSTRATH